MELSEATRRIFLVHWVLVLACLVGGVAVALLIDRNEVPAYVASSRLVLDIEDPKDRAASTAIADTARAIVTSPTHLAAAIAQVGVRRDPVVMAKRSVKLEALGASGVLQLSVRDQDGTVAARLANGLATDLITSRLDISRSQMNQAVADLDVRIDVINREITQVEAARQALQREISQVQAASNQTSQIDALNSLAARRTGLDQEKAALIAARQHLIETAAQRPKAAIVDLAAPSSRPVSSRRLEDVALGALLGLVLGTGLAALLETFRPTLVGREALSRAFHAPVLGELPAPPKSLGSFDRNMLMSRLTLAAAAAGVKVVELVAPGPIDPTALAESLHGEMSAAPTLAGDGPDAVPGLPLIRVFASSIPAGVGSPTAGFVIVTPNTIKQIDLNPISDLPSIAARPLLGLITFKRRRWPWPRAARSAGAFSVGAQPWRTSSRSEGQPSTHPAPAGPPPVVHVPDSFHTGENIKQA